MGLFTKKTKTSFKRNKAGEVVKVEHAEDKPKIQFKRKSKTPVYDKLEKQYYEKHPEETKRYKAKKAGKGLLASFDRMADNYVKNTKKQARKNTSSSKSSTRYIIRGGKAYPIARSTKKKKSRKKNPYSSYDYTNNFNPIGDMFDSGIRSPRKKKRSKGFDPFDNWGFY